MSKPLVIEQGNAFCRVVSGNAKRIGDILTFSNPRAFFDPREPKQVRFLNRLTKEFPSGFLDRVQNELHAVGKRAIVRNAKKYAPLLDTIDPACLYKIRLYDEQVSVSRSMLRHERGAIKVATNGGKSIIMAAVLLALWEKAKIRSIVVVPNTTLLLQLSKDFKKFFHGQLSVGVWGDGKKTIGDVTVITAQSLVKGCASTKKAHRSQRKGVNTTLEKLLRTRNAIFVDEGHHASAETWRRILAACPARFRFVLSGSLKTNDKIRDLTLEGLTGRVLATITNQDLIRKGRSSEPFICCITDPSVHATKCHAKSKVTRISPITGKKIVKRINIEDPKQRYVQERRILLHDLIYNDSIASIARGCCDANFKPAIMTDSIGHLTTLQKRCEKKGLRVYSLWGDIPADERLRRKRAFENDRRGVLVLSTVGDEGMNVPSIGALILTAGGKSIVKALQRVGRAVRKKRDGLNAVLVIDMCARNGEFLPRHTLSRLKIYEEEGFRMIDVPRLHEFLSRMRDGWPAILGQKRYDKLLARQRKLARQSV